MERDEDKWLKKLMKSQRRGLGLSQTTNKTFNNLQGFLWRALRQGLLIRETNVPFVPQGTTLSVASSASRSAAASQQREQQSRGESREMASERTSRRSAQPDHDPASLRSPEGQPVSYGPQGAGGPSIPGSRRESSTQREVTAQGAGNQEAVTGARSSNEGRSDQRQEVPGTTTPVADSETEKECSIKRNGS